MANGIRTRGSYRRRRQRNPWVTLAKAIIAMLVLVAGALLYRWTSDPIPPAPAISGSVEPARKSTERTAALPPLNLPADDAPHGSAMEWWYYNGILAADSGKRFAFHAAVFVANGLVKHTVMHMALTDLQTGKRYLSQSRTGGMPAQQRMAHGFDFEQGNWQVSAKGPEHVLHAAFDGADLALNLTDTGQIVAHRAADSETPGLLDFGSSGISYYYSRPRVAATGEITVDGKPFKVKGTVWFDHQWGEFDVLSLGWDWFALHLSNGSDLMLYELFDAEGKKVMTAGTISNAEGSSPLKPGEVELTPVKTWTSPNTKINYVVEWDLKLPSGVLSVKPYFVDSEFDARASSANVYWEGPVKASGPVSGEGFLELSGYDRLSAAAQPKVK